MEMRQYGTKKCVPNQPQHTLRKFPFPHNFRLGNFTLSSTRNFLPLSSERNNSTGGVYIRYPYLYYAAQCSTLTDTKMKPENCGIQSVLYFLHPPRPRFFQIKAEGEFLRSQLGLIFS